MLFSTQVFLRLFLPLLLLAYFLCPPRGRNALLLAASLWFYAWGEPSLVVIMLLSMGMNYGFGLWAGAWRDRPAGRGVVALAVAANLGLLVYFKYAGFLIDGLNELLALAGIDGLTRPAVRMPIGISFYTFQALSYVIDVHRGDVRAERNPIHVALYVALFPQLIAGPIVRYVDVAQEMRERTVTLAGFAGGIRRFAIGLGKKMLIANSLASVADAAFDAPDGSLTAATAWLGLLCYTLQIYFDFSGYSDMAIGLGWMFGFRFLENFDYPYVAQSITDFWRRWHMSLSTWYRDYLYIPLGGNRGPAWTTYRNLLIVFLLCGLWHGAQWTFVVWGAYHGAFLVVERLGLGRLLARCWRPLRHAYALLAVMVGWTFFKAHTLTHAGNYLAALVGFGGANGIEPALEFSSSERLALAIALVVGIVGALPIVPWLTPRLDALVARLSESNPFRVSTRAALVLAFRTATILFVLLAASSAMYAGTYNPFIYFQF